MDLRDEREEFKVDDRTHTRPTSTILVMRS